MRARGFCIGRFGGKPGAKWALAAALTFVLGPSASGQEPDPAMMKELARDAFFHVTVEGAPSEAGDLNCGQLSSSGLKTCQGKAFAVSPEFLLTAQHMVGGSNDWQWSKKDGLALEVRRAAQLLERSITLQRPAGATHVSGLDHPIVLPAPGSGAPDIAGLSHPGLGLQTFFRLSICEISKNQAYFALMTINAQPDDPSSVNETALVPLEHVGYKPESYGPLYAFAPKHAAGFQASVDGHDGSPIVDAEGSVVAIVSAVTSSAGGEAIILATPIQPLAPVAANIMSRGQGSLKCSLSDTVGQIKDEVRQIRKEVDAHIIWTVNVDRDRASGRARTIRLNYESTSSNPNIASIEIYYEFYGIYKDFAGVGSIPYKNDPYNQTLTNVSMSDDRQREFWTNEIPYIGNQFVEPYVKASAPNKGDVQFVLLYITPTFTNGGGTGRTVVRSFQWVQAR